MQSSSTSNERNVLLDSGSPYTMLNVSSSKDLERLFERGDLGLAGCCPLFEGLALINALWNKLLIVAICCQEFILSALQVFGVFLQLCLSCCLVSFVHLNLLQLCGLCLLGLNHKLIICLLCLCFRSLGVSLHVC